MPDKDYLANRTFDPEKDRLDHGVMGMKWGIRRPRSQLRAAAAKRSESTTGDAAGKPSGGASSKSDAAVRYEALKAQAKAGGGKEMSDDDLKFFNARTEALKKVEKLNESNPGWLKSTAKTVIQKSAQTQMQNLADTLANKYIGAPISESITGAIKKSTLEAAKKSIAEAQKTAKADAQKAIDQSIAKTAADAAAKQAKTDAKSKKPKTLFSGK